MYNALRIHKEDNVIVAIKYIKKNENILVKNLDPFVALDDISEYHKIALQDIAKDKFIIKYKEHIGKASQDIKRGQHVHSHNVSDYREDLNITKKEQ